MHIHYAYTYAYTHTQAVYIDIFDLHGILPFTDLSEVDLTLDDLKEGLVATKNTVEALQMLST
jgi:hypothetical protein